MSICIALTVAVSFAIAWAGESVVSWSAFPGYLCAVLTPLAEAVASELLAIGGGTTVDSCSSQYAAIAAKVRFCRRALVRL